MGSALVLLGAYTALRPGSFRLEDWILSFDVGELGGLMRRGLGYLGQVNRPKLHRPRKGQITVASLGIDGSVTKSSF